MTEYPQFYEDETNDLLKLKVIFSFVDWRYGPSCVILDKLLSLKNFFFICKIRLVCEFVMF